MKEISPRPSSSVASGSDFQVIAELTGGLLNTRHRQCGRQGLSGVRRAQVGDEPGRAALAPFVVHGTRFVSRLNGFDTTRPRTGQRDQHHREGGGSGAAEEYCDEAVLGRYEACGRTAEQYRDHRGGGGASDRPGDGVHARGHAGFTGVDLADDKRGQRAIAQGDVAVGQNAGHDDLPGRSGRER